MIIAAFFVCNRIDKIENMDIRALFLYLQEDLENYLPIELYEDHFKFFEIHIFIDATTYNRFCGFQLEKRCFG